MVTGWLARAGLWASNQGFVAECTIRVLSLTTQPNSDHSKNFFLKMQLTDYKDWKNYTFVALHDLIFSNFVLCFQFRHAKHFYKVFLLLKNRPNFGVKNDYEMGTMWKGTLIFNYLPGFQHKIKKFSYKLFSFPIPSLFWLNSCLSQIVSIRGWKINVVIEVWTCY